MKNVFAGRTFAAAVRTRRGERTLRDASAEIGAVSPATLLRIEQEDDQPDLLTFLHLCDWIRIPPATFLHGDDTRTLPLDEVIERELRADGVLPPSVIDAFLILLRACS